MTESIGITGTRHGATSAQLQELFNALIKYHLIEPVDFHHGACTGVDQQAALIGRAMGFHVIAHPPDNPKYLSQVSLEVSRTVLPELPYLARDVVIVDKVGLLFALPRTPTPEPRSGTWYTYKYAVQQKKPTVLILPDGSIK